MNQAAHQPLSYTVNSAPVAPAAFYRIACHPQRHVVVEACAGAGKTWMLVARIARALLNGIEPHNILAITFTNKAAAEMRGRVAALLQEWAQHDDATLRQELLARGLSEAELTPELLRRASGLHADILAGRGVGIRTFHGWFASLLRMAPLSLMQSLGLPSPYELLQDDAEAMALVWPQFYKAVHGDEQLLADFRHALATSGRSNLNEALVNALGKRVEIGLASSDALLHGVASLGDTVPAFANCTNLQKPLEHMPGMAQALRDAALSLGASGNAAAAKAATALGMALDNADMHAAAKVLLTGEGKPREKGLKALNPALVQTAQEWAQQWQQALHQTACIEHQQRMARLSLCLIDCFTALKHQRGWVDMNDIELAAGKLLADSELSAWVQQRLDASVSQLLIDEFQDTNPMQWRALLSWLEGYVGAGGGNLPYVFIVGDPKQSIYRFRRAEPRVFRAATEFIALALGGDVLACDHTRRNAIGVVQALNAVMLPQSHACDEAPKADVAAATAQAPLFRTHTTDKKTVGAVLALPLIHPDVDDAAHQARAVGDEQVWRDSLLSPKVVPEEKRVALEIQQAAQWVAHKVSSGVAARNIMVIARTNARLGLMQSSLSALGIACAQPEKSTLIDSPAVADVVALLDALISPSNDLALARALRSPLFGASDQDLLWLSVVAKAGAKSGLPMGWRAALDSACHNTDAPAMAQQWADTLDHMRTWLRELTLVQLLTTIYERCDVLASYAAAVPPAMVGATHAQLMALLDESLALNQGRFVTPYQFVRAVKAATNKRAWPTPPNAVQLLTVHGAKGLEAPCVLLLDTHAPAKKAQTMSMLVDWPSDAPAPTRVVFVAREKQPPICAQGLLATDQQARAVEENNALYVAVTRAGDELVLSAHSRAGNKDDSWWSRLVTHAQLVTVAQTHDQTDAAAPTQKAQVAIKRLPKWHARPVFADGAASAKPTAAQEESARLGQAMHQLLEWLPAKLQATEDLWLTEQLQRVQRNWQLSAEALELARTWACNIVRGEGAWAWQDSVVGFAGNEVDIMVDGALMRLDRLVQRRDTKEWWVLDFKSSHQPQLDQTLLRQLDTYRAAVATIYHAQVVRSAFLTASGALIEPAQ